MEIVVKKFGGSSVSSLDKIKKIAKKICDNLDSKKVLVVVSAMGDTTNNLLDMASTVSKNASKRNLDSLLAIGEQQTASLLAMAIEDLNYKSISLTGYQCKIKTDSFYNNASILDIDSSKILNHFKTNDVLVVTGFQGFDEFDNITTLGRGGSDTSAVALAIALDALCCEIYTDVDGIYSFDPRKIDKAKHISQISYDEALEMAYCGAKVLHDRCVKLASYNNLKIYVKSTFDDKKFTLVSGGDNMEKFKVKGIATQNNLVKLNIKYDNLFRLLNFFRNKKINIDNLSTYDSNISFSLSKDSYLEVEDELNSFLDNIDVVYDLVKVSIIGFGINENLDITSKILNELNDYDIHLLSSSACRYSFLIDEASSLEISKLLHSNLIESQIVA